MKLGAKGYLLKQDYKQPSSLIRAVYTGQSVFGNEIMSKIPGYIQSDTEEKTDFSYEEYDISPREQEVIRLIAEGMSNKEIASGFFSAREPSAIT